MFERHNASDRQIFAIVHHQDDAPSPSLRILDIMSDGIYDLIDWNVEFEKHEECSPIVAVYDIFLGQNPTEK